MEDRSTSTLRGPAGVSKQRRGLLIGSLLCAVFFGLSLLASPALCASSRRLPLHYQVHTYGSGATRDYSSLGTWEDDTDLDLIDGVTTVNGAHSSGVNVLNVVEAQGISGEDLFQPGGTFIVDPGGAHEEVLTVQSVTGDAITLQSATTQPHDNGEGIGTGFVLECYKDSSSYNDYVTIKNATTDSDYFRVIKPASGEGHDGTPGTGVKFSRSAGFLTIDIQENYAGIYDLEVVHTGTSASAWGAIRIYYANPGRVVGCLLALPSSTDSTGAALYVIDAASSGIVVNTLAYDSARAGLEVYSGVGRFYNCTAVNSTYGFRHMGGTAIAKNCIAENNTTNWDGTWTKTTCTDDDGVAFVDAANDDYHLAASDTAAKDQGTDLSSDADFAFDDDVDGDTRSGSWDIGFDEYGPSFSPLLIFY